MQAQSVEIVIWVLFGFAVVAGLMLAPRFEAWLDEMLGEIADAPGSGDDGGHR
jgi:hypothetical protein